MIISTFGGKALHFAGPEEIMEIELKYRIPDEETAARIWEDRLFAEIEEEGTREEIRLEAVYYDTPTYALAKNEIAYRVRREGDRLIATLKWKGKSEDGLHVREELAVPVAELAPDIRVFLESDIGAELESLLAGQELTELMRTRILRRQFRIDTGTGLFEISVDKGEVSTVCGDSPVLEVEAELYSGETEELLQIGRQIQETYGLEPENTSKYAKGIEKLCRGCRQEETDREDPQACDGAPAEEAQA